MIRSISYGSLKGALRGLDSAAHFHRAVDDFLRWRQSQAIAPTGQ